ncbi:Midasin [Acropora cervicornis]|uniref:Midasin n=1 Tax=Acropora cervicornis TaxID=6130 RepID=A0AAD9R072_ACRCE|nr:Midasin [Acropora cervicornis]
MECSKNFRFEFFSALHRLSNSDTRLKDELSHFLQVKRWCFQDKQNLLQKLAELVIYQDFSPFIVDYCKPILLEIVERAAQIVHQRSFQRNPCFEEFCYFLSTLLEHSHLKDFIYRFLKSSSLLSVFSEEDGKLDQSDERILRVLKTGYNLLCFDFQTFHNLWDWSPVLKLSRHQDAKVRWFAVRIIAMLMEMSDKAKLNLSEKCFTAVEINSSLMEDCFGKGLVRGFPIVNDFMEVDIISPDGSFFSDEDFLGNYTTICGVVLPRLGEASSPSDRSLVMVPKAINNLHSLVLSIASGCGVLLEGIIGCGKTTLVEYVARTTGRSGPPEFIKIQLGDQTDSKSLLGKYICTDTPGEFVWQPGPLLQAVQEGHWILLEDIDQAPMDVISILIPLLESRALSVPAHGNSVKASPGFQLFATQRSYTSQGGGSYQIASANSAILDKLWIRVQIEPLSKGELVDVLSVKYPDLGAVAGKLVDIFCLLSADSRLISDLDISNSALPHDKRLCSTRDFMKWCSRIAITACGTPSQLDQNNVFLEAQDCFTAPLPKAEDRRLLDIAIGAKLGLTTEKVEFFSSIYKPSVHVSPLSLTVGRISLKRNAKEKTRVPWNRNSIPRYSHTRHSSVLLEKLAACIRNKEPVLLVGETGTGKTATVQYLAAQCLTTLKVVNMSQQSDSSDLLGGYKPVEMKQIVAPVREKFEVLFCKTFSRKQNVKFLGHVQKCYAEGTWEIVFKLMMHAQKNALERTMKDDRIRHLRLEWQTLHQEIKQLRKQQKNAESALAFRFMEGSLVQALRNGDWVLLDEINLATPETLECLCGLLESSSGSLVLVERGDVTPTVRHDDFRLFACMNPATDVGKKDLPPGIRNRFTEIFVNELEDTADLNTLVMDYLKGLSPNATIVDGIVRFYLTVKHEAKEKLTDGTGHKPHYSLRTLCRALQYAATNPHQSALRSIYEGFCLSFLTQLDRSSHPNVQSLIQRFLLGHVNPSSILNQPLLIPRGGGEFCNFEGFWIARGSKEPFVSPEYVLTLSVKANLKDLSRVVSARYLPVLIQGETSVGKTSLIQWLAKASGNHCVRINNHEHTDIQEYLGCYTSDENGKLVFKEGVLVDAMRKGYWIILDELNLAPSDVLEALNRLLDDNRELFIPETQETIAAHPMFMLFATQNPPGHYGGRKVLSRAFRNRFVELHFDELPSQELELILHQRCSLPSSYAKKLVAIMLDLQARRRSTNVFAGKQGFITLRDLFRWAERYSKTPDEPSGGFRDWDRHIAEDGYMLLAGRCRNPSECAVIQEVIELHMKRKINLDLLFGDPSSVQLSPGISELITQVTTSSLEGFEHIVWTHSMRRLAILAGRALQFGEPVLLVGETGCGKTTICQLLAALWNQKLFAVNCHMHSESSDFLGGLRPVRNRGHDEQGEQLSKLFEWCDGPLVLAMKDGAVLLVDEISLADDSVLERLNSVLEPERTLLLAEKGGGALDAREDVNILVAHDNFRIIGTMNPGGDFGKKELSPALRNRFTEIWCPPSKSREDLVQIIEHNIKSDISFESASPGSSGIGEAIMNFIEWLHSTEFGKKFVVSIRDLLSWVNFINTCSNGSTTFEDNYHGNDKILLSPSSAYVHGACLVFLDALGSTSSPSSSSVCAVKDAYQTCLEFLRRQVHVEGNETSIESEEFDTTNDRGNFFGVHPFYIKIGPLPISGKLSRSYAFNSPTTSQNAQRLLRALQLSRPILLEGSPGVGKTSLVGAIAKASGHELIRINLSEQTDVTDLFGADLPVEGGEAGQFVWRDGPLLKALKAGHWVVLDELNLASQSVLEGLNACLDHRAEVYIPELGMAFRVQKGQTRLFACQNPLNQGGGRKGLPKSFLNRFTQVYVEPLSKSDLLFITGALYPRIDASVVDKMVTFNMKVHQDTVVEGKWGRKGSPWEFNLRDVFRWCDLLIKHQSPGFWNPGQFVRLIYSDRMRTVKDKQMLLIRRFRLYVKVVELFQSVFDSAEQMEDIRNIRPSFHITPFHVQVLRHQQSGNIDGHGYFKFVVVIQDMGRTEEKRCATVDQASITARPLQVLHQCLPTMESLMKCVEMNWMTVLVGSRSCGKTSLVHLLAQLTGNKLEVMAMNSAMDTTELLGGFEQADLNRQWGEIVTLTKDLVLSVIRETLLTDVAIPRCLQEMSLLYKLWIGCSGQEKEGDDDSSRDLLSLGKMDAFLSLLESVENICRSIGFNSFSTGIVLTSYHRFRNGTCTSLEPGRRSLFGTANAFAMANSLSLSFDVESLRDMLQSLRQRLIANGDSSHCSGQFEWVDGQLVEALKSGHWLLIDNVNFCSPSVLDRLNALLEPGGVLTIDERGVINGEIPSIKPHPNFRLILAMDPRYGEISRAMRNRGVEIFMLGEEDDQSFDKYDHEMLLHGLGLHDSSLCSSVVNFHTDLKKTLRGSILDTLRAASLTSDLILRGSRKKDAFVTALKQVYVRNHVSDRNKQIAEELVTRHTFIMENVENETSIPSIAALFPSAKDYHTNSIMAMITLHSLPTLQVLRSPQTGAQLEFATLVFLERSSVHDWKLRLDYLQSLAQSALGSAPCQLQNRVASIVKGFVHSFGALFSSQLMEKLNNIRSDVTSAQFDSQMLDHFPVDLRMNKDLFDQLNQTQSNASLLDAISGIVNRLSLLELEARRCYVEGDSCHPVNSPSRNVLQLSSAYQSGQLQMERLPHPVVVHLLPFFKLFSSFLEFCISQESQFTDTHYWTVTDGLVWRDRLWRTCQKLSRENFTMSSLSLHWTWVVQHTLNSVPVAFGLLDYRQLPSELVTVINQLNGILATGSRMAEVFYKILTAYGHPPPFRSKLSSEIWERLQHLCQRIDPFPNKLQGGANEERLRDLQRKLVSVFRDVMENRLQGGHLQCGEFKDFNFCVLSNGEIYSEWKRASKANTVSVIQSLEETVDSMLMQARDTVLHDAECCEIARPPTDNSTTSEAEMGKTLLALFESICSLQEHTVLATLMSGLANQMACRSVRVYFNSFRRVKENYDSRHNREFDFYHTSRSLDKVVVVVGGCDIDRYLSEAGETGALKACAGSRIPCHQHFLFKHTRQAEACMCVWMNVYILAIVSDVPLKAIAKQKQATFRQIEKVEEQMQSLTAYQLNKTSRKPETTARYQYLQAIFPQGDNLSENFGAIFKPVESDLLCNYWLLKSSSLWSQNVQGQLALVPEQGLNCQDASVHSVLGGARSLLASSASKKLLVEAQGPLQSLTIDSYHDNIKQLQVLCSHFWVNGDVLDNYSDVDRETSIRLFVAKLSHVVLSIKEILPPRDQKMLLSLVEKLLDSREDDEGLASAINDLRKAVLGAVISFKQATGNEKHADLICSLLKNCLEELSLVIKNTPSGAAEFLWDSTRLGYLWVNLGLAQSIILSPVGPVDPVEKDCVELQYVTEQIQRIEDELKVRFYAEEIWTGLTTDPEKFELLLSQESWNETQLTSNPFRVKRLFTKLQELRARVKSLEKNVAFRPAVSQDFLFPIFTDLLSRAVTTVSVVFTCKVGQFDAILNEVKHFTHSVGDARSVIVLAESMRDVASDLFTLLKDGTTEHVSSSRVHSAVNKAKAWHISASRFVEHMVKDYPLYCDLLAPFVAGISQYYIYIVKYLCTSTDDWVGNLGKTTVLTCEMLSSGFRPWVENVNKTVFYSLLILLSTQAIYGIALMSARLSVLLQQHTFVAQLPAATCLKLTTPDEKMISSLCQCPNPRSSSPLDLAISLTSYSMQTIIQALVKCFCVDDQASSISALLSYRVVRLSLLNVQIHSLQHGFLDQKTHQALNSILVIFLDKWRIYQEQERQREEEEGSLFKYKDRSHGSNMSEEEENEVAVRRAFPSFDSEFKDIMVQDDLNDSGEQPQLENTPPESLLASNAELFMAAMKDYSEVRSVHEEMFCRLLSSRDLSFGVKDSCLNSSVDALYRQAFEWGYQTAGMLKAITPWLATEAQLSCSHILQSCILRGNFEMERGSTLPFNFLNTVGNAKGGRPFNIYHDSNIQEAVKVKPVLQDFSARVQELLAEWPRHPNLVQLMVVIERILSFPVTSPLMRLLTGLEVLLKKSQLPYREATPPLLLLLQYEMLFFNLYFVGLGIERCKACQSEGTFGQGDSANHTMEKNGTQVRIQFESRPAFDILLLLMDAIFFALRCWSSLLDVTSDEAAARSSHWWFHIYNLLQQFRTGSAENACTENVPEINELVEAFQKFIESSTLGEFSSRVKMLFVFYKEMCSEEESNQDLKAKVSDVLWNVHSYYKQFVPRVEQSLSEGREPIEKELKGFAKIAKWNDSNFWAMKQAADKSHYTLHKFVRKYESCLNEPVQKILMNAKSVLASPEDKTQTEFNEQIILQTEWFISPDHIKGYYDEDLQLASSCEALGLSLPTGHSRLPKLFQKMRKLSSQLLNERGYMQRVLSLDDFTGEVISRSKELQALDVMNQPKEKRKELGKHIQQRKRKSLSDLFKILSSIGVSYRKGLNLERQSTSKESMTLAAVDEEAVVNSVSLLSDSPSDLIHKVSQLAHGCCHHFFKALARSAAFDVVIVTPSKELGIGEIDRCKGCTSHLLHVCYEQRKVISRFSRDIRNASVCLQQLSQMVDFTSDGQRSRCSFLPPQAELQRRTVRVMDLLTCASQVLQQVFTLLRCCPNDANESSPPEWSPFPQSMLSSVALSSSSDDVITDLAQKLKCNFSSFSQLFSQRDNHLVFKEATNEVQRLAKDIRPYAAVSDHVLHNSRRDDITAFVTSWRQFDKVEKAFFKLQSISEMIAGMLPRFESKCCHIDQGFGGALVDLKNKVLKECDDFFTWREDTLGGGDEHEFWNTEESHEQAMATVDSFFGDVDSLNTSLLLATQRLAKIAENSGNENTEVGETADEEPDFENFQLQDKHLTTLLHQKLLEEINSLHMANVSKGTESLLSRLRTLADNTACGSFLRKSADLCAQMLGTSIPFLHQFLSLSQHLLVNLLASHRATSKLLSVLLSIFTDLASKGFCLPPEIEEGEGEGPTEFEDIEEGGLGEGEGIKDVSDQIESEDQLDDTKREGQEQDKKEEDQEQIPDEENGIEMSENFDGALHDLEAGEDQDDEKSEDENEEENELDKQMGEVDGQEAEKLDEKMWGDSDEEDEQEEKEMKEEKGTGAEAESQSQLVAKEDNKGAAEESKDKTDQSQDPEVEEEQTQPNEADYNEEGNLDDEGATGEQEQQQSQNPEEVEDLDLPDDLQLDGDGKEDNDGQEEMETDDFEGDKGKEENAEDEMPADDDQLCGDKDKSDQQAMADEEDTEEKDESKKHRDGEMPNVSAPKDEKEDDSSDGDQEDWRTKSDTKSQENVQAVEDSRQGDGSGEQSEETAGQSESTEGSEERGLGQADAADSEGHCGKSSTAQVPVNANQQLKESRQRKQMNRARSDRALGSMDETTHKRLKTVDDSETVSNAEANEAKRQDLFQHIQNDVSTNYDAQTLDSATADQAEEQEKGNFPDMDSEADKDEDDDYEMQSAFLEDKDEFPTPERPQRSRMLPPVKPRSTEDTEQEEEAETENREEDMETNNPEEITADRLLSTYHSSEIALAFERMDISSLDPDKLRSVLEHQLAHWSNLDRGTIEEQQVAQEAWRKYEFLTAGLSQELCEQLRLVLEPALASKLKYEKCLTPNNLTTLAPTTPQQPLTDDSLGDYRSGKRLNMRKVIPYIASQFRKDKIWLRRTKPSKRQYQIMLAVDDSSSMKDNHSKQLAFESLAVISNALTRLEAGDLGICSFGETVQLLHPFHEPFSDQSGAKILQQFTFDQKKTKIAQLLDTCTSLMLSAQRSQLSPRIRRDTSQLLLIVSDGRGIFLEGVETVQKAVRFARQANIFMVFVILDNPANKDSILDIRFPIFRPSKPPEIKSYMEQFPFPFYIILRDINALPQILSDALRQWFELVASME